MPRGTALTGSYRSGRTPGPDRLESSAAAGDGRGGALRDDDVPVRLRPLRAGAVELARARSGDTGRRRTGLGPRRAGGGPADAPRYPPTMLEADGEPVDIRAFQGTRQASVYREHHVSERAFARILAIGAERGLPVLSSLDRHGPQRLDKPTARRLADEAERIRIGGELLDLDDDLTVIAELARWCSRASGAAWIRIERPAAPRTAAPATAP